MSTSTHIQSHRETTYCVERSIGGVWQEESTHFATIDAAREYARALIDAGRKPVRLLKVKVHTSIEVLESTR